MKRTVFYTACAAILILIIAGARFRSGGSANIKALVIVPAAYGANLNLILDDCQQYGVEITTAGLTKVVTPCQWASGRAMPKLTVDSLISEIKDVSRYDCLIFSYATWRYNDAFSDIMADINAMALIKKANDKGLVIYMPCSAPRVMAKANLVKGRSLQAVGQVKNELTGAGAVYKGENLMPLTDSNYISATRGMYYHTENFDALIAAIQKKRSLTK